MAINLWFNFKKVCIGLWDFFKMWTRTLSAGRKCIYCGSSNLNTYLASDSGRLGTYQMIHCKNCGREYIHKKAGTLYRPF